MKHFGIILKELNEKRYNSLTFDETTGKCTNQENLQTGWGCCIGKVDQHKDIYGLQTTRSLGDQIKKEQLHLIEIKPSINIIELDTKKSYQVTISSDGFETPS